MSLQLHTLARPQTWPERARDGAERGAMVRPVRSRAACEAAPEAARHAGGLRVGRVRRRSRGQSGRCVLLRVRLLTRLLLPRQRRALADGTCMCLSRAQGWRAECLRAKRCATSLRSQCLWTPAPRPCPSLRSRVAAPRCHAAGQACSVDHGRLRCALASALRCNPARCACGCSRAPSDALSRLQPPSWRSTPPHCTTWRKRATASATWCDASARILCVRCSLRLRPPRSSR
jgi:hypothetical protein